MQKGGEYAARAISEHFGINVLRYISFSRQEFISFIDSFEPIAIDIPENMSQTDRKNDIYIKIDQGRRLIGGSLMLDIFAYTKWKGKAPEGLYQSALTLATFLSQNGSKLMSAESFILSSAKTNLSALDFEQKRELLNYHFSRENPVESVRIYGEFQLENTQFVLTSASKTKISAIF